MVRVQRERREKHKETQADSMLSEESQHEGWMLLL